MYASDGIEQWLKMNKNFVGPFGEWNRIATELYGHIAQQNIEIIEENFSRFSEQLKRFRDVKKPEDFIHLQKDCLDEDINAAIKNTQKIIHTTLENMETMTKLCGSMTEFTPVVKTFKKEFEDRQKK